LSTSKLDGRYRRNELAVAEPEYWHDSSWRSTDGQCDGRHIRSGSGELHSQYELLLHFHWRKYISTGRSFVGRGFPSVVNANADPDSIADTNPVVNANADPDSITHVSGTNCLSLG
jgi:hypothetical protein